MKVFRLTLNIRKSCQWYAGQEQRSTKVNRTDERRFHLVSELRYCFHWPFDQLDE